MTNPGTGLLHKALYRERHMKDLILYLSLVGLFFCHSGALTVTHLTPALLPAAVATSLTPPTDCKG